MFMLAVGWIELGMGSCVLRFSGCRLCSYFGQIGTIKEGKGKDKGKKKVWIYKNKQTGQPKGDATVSYEDPNAAEGAVSWFNNKPFEREGGPKLTISVAERKTNPLYAGGGAGGGGQGGGGYQGGGGGAGGGGGGYSGGGGRGGGPCAQPRTERVSVFDPCFLFTSHARLNPSLTSAMIKRHVFNCHLVRVRCRSHKQSCSILSKHPQAKTFSKMCGCVAGGGGYNGGGGGGGGGYDRGGGGGGISLSILLPTRLRIRSSLHLLTRHLPKWMWTLV